MKKFAILGIVSGLSMPPLCIFPIIILSYAEIFNLLISKNTSIKFKMLNLSLFLLLFNATSMYWLYKPFLVVNMYVLIMPILLLILFLYLSLFHFIGGYIFSKITIAKRSNYEIYPILFGIIFTAMDVLIGTLFGGFPWNFIGYSCARFLPFVQSASFLKIYGISFLLFVISGYLGFFIDNRKKKNLVIAIVILSVNLLYGVCKIYFGKTDDAKKFDISIIETNTAQDQKWNQYLAESQLNHYILLTLKSQENHRSKLIIWPEAAFPYLITKNANLYRVFHDILFKDQTLLFGTIFKEKDDYYNSLITINSNCGITNVYHKVKLTPFGEYLPFRWLPFIDKIANDSRDFAAGKQSAVINISGIKVLPLICYEGIFPIFNKNYDCIINISNDAWFDGTIGIDQLFYISRFRAIEAESTLIRCSNAGISAIFDKCGRIIWKSEKAKEQYFLYCN